MGTILLWVVAFLTEPHTNLGELPIAVGRGTIASFVVAWPLVLGVLVVALIFAASVSRHPHVWSAASVVVMAFGSFAFVHYWEESPRHVFDLTQTSWELIYLSIALVAAGAVAFSTWCIWSPFERTELSPYAPSPWIRRRRSMAVAVLGAAAIVIGALLLEWIPPSEPCLDRGGFLNPNTGECVEGRD